MVVLLGSVGGSVAQPSCQNFAVTADCIPSDGASHSVGDVKFGADGKIYVSTGDAASFDEVDPLALRSQNIDSLAGKILRINPDGTAPTDNPYFNGSVTANRSKVWNYGLRNPFRFTFRPSNSVLFIGDVGWFSWEELNVGTSGANFGWPCREGSIQTPGYTCTASSPQSALYAYAHDPQTGAGSVTAGVFYTGNSYPTAYTDTLFFGDYAQDWIKRAVIDSNNNLIAVEDFQFDAGGPVAFATDLQGNVHYLSIYTGEVRKIVYTGGNRAPIPVASATPNSGLAPLPVQFSSASSSDPDGNALTFTWNFGNGTTSNLPNPTHTYTVNGSYTVTLVARDGVGGVATTTLPVVVGNRPPVASIVNPPNNSYYVDGQVIPLHGSATDPDTGSLPESAYSWDILLHHNVHVHFLQTLQGSRPSFIAPDHGDEPDVYIEAKLTVTDNVGLTDTKSITLHRAPAQTVAPYFVSATTNPSTPTLNQPIIITAHVGNNGAPEPILVDIELFNSQGEQVAQHFYDNQTISTGSTSPFILGWTPVTSGTYRVAVGLMYPNWSGLHQWTNDALTFSVGTATSTGGWSPTTPNGALRFDGVDDHVDTAVWNIEEPNGFSIESRLSADSFSGDQYIIAKSEGGTFDWALGTRAVSGSQAQILYKLRTSTMNAEVIGGTLVAGTLSQISAVYDGSSVTLYQDGLPVASQAVSGAVATSPSRVWLGARPEGAGAYDGLIDEIRVWNEPQTAAEISQFQGELTQKENGLIKNWRFNEGFGQVVIDSSNSGHHGTLGSLATEVDSQDPAFVAGRYAPGGTFSPVHVQTIVGANPTIGVPTTLTTTVQNTGTGSGFAIINVEVYDAGGAQVLQRFFDGEGFAPGQIRTFEIPWTPQTEGTYRVAVGVVHLFWSNVYEWTNQAALIPVGSALPTEFDLTVGTLVFSPASPSVGTSVTVTVPVTNTGGAGSALIDIELYQNGAKIAQEFFDDEAFTAGETRQFTLTFTPASEGFYGAAVGLFHTGWSGMYSWNSGIGGFTAGASGSGGPTPVVAYTNNLSEGWASWSWGATVDLASGGAPPATGGAAIGVTYTDIWGGLYLHADTISVVGKTSLIFDISGGAPGGQDLNIRALDGTGALLPQRRLSSYLPTFSGNTWHTVTIPLADLGLSDATQGLIIQGASGNLESTYYIDTLRFE
jgi:PKD repeat protein